jgi:hypothetical protein
VPRPEGKDLPDRSGAAGVYPESQRENEATGYTEHPDRVVQAAVHLILESIFESDLLECSRGFRPGHSAHDALEVIRESLAQGRCTVTDADTEGCFGSIPLDKLLGLLI